MSVEKRLVAACLKSREAFGIIDKTVNKEGLTPYASYLIDLSRDFYARDKEAKAIDLGYIDEKLSIDFDTPTKVNTYRGFAHEAFSLDLSAINVAAVIFETTKKEKATQLAQSLLNGDEAPKQLELLSDHLELLEVGATTIDDVLSTDDTEVINNLPVVEANASLNPTGLIRIGSKVMTEYLGGGVSRGDHIIIFGRPEIGKDAMWHTIVRGLVLQKLPGLVFQNEDAIRKTVGRFQGCLSGKVLLDRLKEPDETQAILDKRGYNLATFISIAPGSVQQIDRYCEQFNPVWIVVNQLRNLSSASENRTNQLEAIATGLRNIAKRRNCLVLSVTQAGDSASNKLVLDMGDIDSSNTGIPAQADLMVGIGCNEEFERNGLRMISFPKNKMSGQHVHFRMKFNPLLSLYEDI